MIISAVILAGGQARRYGGIAKGLIPCPNGRTILARLIDEIETAEIPTTAISANEPLPYLPFGKPVIADLRPGRGPLGGIEAALNFYSQLRPQGVLILPCDLPGISHREIVRLRDAFCRGGARVVVAETEDRQWHPLCAVVRPDILSELQCALDEDRREVKRLWGDLGAIGVGFADSRPFLNVNGPEDLQRWREDAA
ncbi:MAG: molybdenum cofactor guanylyltransferase [Pirellulales bacterium]|nr:molybdenum cofactor guanylyltransferase [Pirellulales bacterium]